MVVKHLLGHAGFLSSPIGAASSSTPPMASPCGEACVVGRRPWATVLRFSTVPLKVDRAPSSRDGAPSKGVRVPSNGLEVPLGWRFLLDWYNAGLEFWIDVYTWMLRAFVECPCIWDTPILWGIDLPSLGSWTSRLHLETPVRGMLRAL